jgi:hypothetical protein
LRDYELIVIISPEVPEEELPAHLDKISEFITNKGGSEISLPYKSFPGRKLCANAVKARTRHDGGTRGQFTNLRKGPASSADKIGRIRARGKEC